MQTRARSAGRLAKALPLATLLSLGLAASAGAAELHVMPFPGTPDASPATRVIFPAVAPSEIASVRVVGSRSGDDPGRLVRLPDRAGVSYVPDHPFTPGERVHVRAQLGSAVAAATLGSSGTVLSYRFTVAIPAGDAPQRRRSPPVKSRTGTFAGMSFHSLPGLHPPRVTVTGRAGPGAGDIFVTPRNSYQRLVKIQHGPMILNRRGQLLWFRWIRDPAVVNLEVQTYEGQPVLTWWQGTNDFIGGEDVITNSSYRTVATLRASPTSAHYVTDAHDFQITPQGTALVQAFTHVQANLMRLGGPANGVVQDDIIQELDIRTGKVLWEWHAYGHIPLSASYVRPSGSAWFDYLHMNSVQALPDGNILISGRNTWGVYEISKRTGRIIWTLGGKDSSFDSRPGSRFSWQHDAHLTGHTLTVFDDASDGPSVQEAQSSGKVLSLNTLTMTARLVRRDTHKPAELTPSQGSVQLLPGGDAFIAWGAGPQFSEYTRTGRQIFDARFTFGVNTYRAYRFPWVGHPRTPPALALGGGSGQGTTLYASWNGATQVIAWRVLGGPSPRSLHWVARAARTGFETTIRVGRSRRYFAVQALGAERRVLGTSPAKPAPGH